MSQLCNGLAGMYMVTIEIDIVYSQIVRETIWNPKYR